MAWDFREPLTHYPEPLRSALLAERDLIDGIHKRVVKHPERNPMTNRNVRKLAEIAYQCFSKINSEPLSFEDYFEDTRTIHPQVDKDLTNHGY